MEKQEQKQIELNCKKTDVADVDGVVDEIFFDLDSNIETVFKRFAKSLTKDFGSWGGKFLEDVLNSFTVFLKK